MAKFCWTKLLDDKTDHKKTITIKNSDNKIRKADKQIDLTDVAYENEGGTDYYNPATQEGVRYIQTALNKLGFLEARYITGVYGPITTEAVKRFQEKNNLPQTGQADSLTKEKLARS